MQERGRLQEGMVADITIFDAETVRDNATYEKGSLPTTGIPYVIVNGKVVVKDSKVLPDVFPGEPIRFPVEDKGRFEPLDEDTWKTPFHGCTCRLSRFEPGGAYPLRLVRLGSEAAVRPYLDEVWFTLYQTFSAS